MTQLPRSPQECKNLLLSMLPDADYRTLIEHFEFVSTPLRSSNETSQSNTRTSH